MRTKQLLTKTLLVVAVLLAGASSAWAVDVPDPVYFNDFSSNTGLTIVGSGQFADDADARFGKIYLNDPENSNAVRTNYLKLPTDVLSHSATSKEMTIGFWVNKKNEATTNLYYPIFAAYTGAPRTDNLSDYNQTTNENGMPMFVCQSRGILQYNNESEGGSGSWCNFEAAQNSAASNTENNDWCFDGNWHYYTVTLTETSAIVYVDGVVVNSWTLDNSTDGQKMTAFFTNTTLTYVTLGGNQAWGWGDPDPAFGFDDFAVYDEALTPAQIEKIIDTKLGYTKVTYDVDALSAVGNLTLSDVQAAREKTTPMYLPTNCAGLYDRIAFQNNGTWNINASGLSNTETNKGRHLAILGLIANDKLTITYSGGTFKTRDVGALASLSDYTVITSGQEYTASAAGIAMFELKSGARVSEIILKTTTTETVTAPAISSEANGAARTVTITDGVSNIKSGVTTYYTTDGSTPTSASTAYTAPFDVNATCTVKAITISNSSAETASTVTSQLIDLDVVDTPTATMTLVNGIYRTITFDCATDGATTAYSIYDGENWSDYTTATTLVISANTTLKVKATKNAKEAVSDEYNFEAGTTVNLAAATVTHSAANQYTLSNNQSALPCSPTATVHYQINGGAEQTSTATSIVIPVTTDATLTYWLTATGYGSTEPANASMYAVVPLATVTTIDLCTATSAAWASRGDAIGGLDGYYKYVSAEGATEPIVSDGIFAATFSNGTDGNSTWRMQQTKGGTKNQNSAEKIAVLNVEKDQVVRVMCDIAPTVEANATVLEGNTYPGTYSFTASADGHVLLNIAKNTVITKIYVEESTVSVTVTDAGYATYVSEYNLDFTSTSIKAYEAKVSTGKVVLTPINKVQAGTGVVLYKEGGDTESIPVCADYDDADNNELVAGTGAAIATTDGDYTNYILNKVDGIGFYKAAGQTVASNRAYLHALTANVGSAPLYMFFEDGSETTGIDAIEHGTLNIEHYYDLQGRRVAQPTKGLYIVNGKKVVIK